MIALAKERYAKALWTDRSSTQKPEMVNVSDEAGQARWVADQVLRHREAGSTLKSQAVLFRTSTHSAALELELARRNMEMFSEAMRMLTPFAPGASNSAAPADRAGKDAKKPAEGEDIEALRRQLKEMQKTIDTIAGRG